LPVDVGVFRFPFSQGLVESAVAVPPSQIHQAKTLTHLPGQCSCFINNLAVISRINRRVCPQPFFDRPEGPAWLPWPYRFPRPRNRLDASHLTAAETRSSTFREPGLRAGSAMAGFCVEVVKTREECVLTVINRQNYNKSATLFSEFLLCLSCLNHRAGRREQETATVPPLNRGKTST
jgi:hypothetical protein